MPKELSTEVLYYDKMVALGELHQSDIKSFLRTNCIEMIKELQDNQSRMMEMYKQSPTFPFDFYNLSLRETDTKIQTIREFYTRITSEDL
ncbi:MAG: hypothetical protein AUG16_03770 [Thaumarchaeota archaeon 13_1_20CM_2_39_20]|nr:MAG: hypothetical protein AUI59_01180 [Thaumarchaeota archaeon 13_1_40CM_2_39_13_1]OLE40507.1 MAG: hypothetical protein AUG16_03770 [Thaumarchaeota archaeon 13_1_20CM_2_39_20]